MKDHRKNTCPNCKKKLDTVYVFEERRCTYAINPDGERGELLMISSETYEHDAECPHCNHSLPEYVYL